MTCAACPITVRKALSHVAGVSASTVDTKAHTATITFDPTRTTPEALAMAVTNAGFPARVLRNGS
jgi:mercuric ion binding protein